ncbi:MAG: hypothetical protein WC485_10605 [Opitutaceae bacterium]
MNSYNQGQRKNRVASVKKGRVDRPMKPPRAGWADAFNRMAAAEDDHLVYGEAPTATRFDAKEWQW